MKRIILSYPFIGLSLCFAITFSVGESRAMLSSTSIGSKVERSSHIVLGEVVRIEGKTNNEIFATVDIITEVAIAVERDVKGESQGKEIVVVVPGGTVGDTTVTFYPRPVSFEFGELVVVYLQRSENGELFKVVDGFEGKHTVYSQGAAIDGWLFLMTPEGPMSARDYVNGVKTIVDGNHSKLPSEVEKRRALKPARVLSDTVVITDISPNTASAGTGTSVTISGDNFGSSQDPDDYVVFYEYTDGEGVYHAVVATVSSWTNTNIVCDVPALASSGPVWVIRDYGYDDNWDLWESFTVTFSYSGKRWSNSDLPVEYYINEDGTSDCTGEFDAIQNAFQTWEMVGTSYMDFKYMGTTSSSKAWDDKNVCLWGTLSFPDALAECVTLSSGSQIIEIDMIFNADSTWSTTEESDKRDVQSAATHEAGHFLCLADLYGVADTAKTMYGRGYPGETKARDLESEDIAGIKHIYPALTSGTTSGDTLWAGTIAVTGDVTVSNGYTLTIWSGTTVNLNSHCLKSTGGTITDNTDRGNWNPDIAVRQGGTLKGRYSTIQSAINAATSGQKVYVGTGTYDEQISMKAGVDLEGQSSSNTIINVGLGYVAAVNFSQVNNAKVTGFKLRGYAAVNCYNCSPTIEGNAMYDSEYGIYMMNSSAKIKDNSISGCTYGIMAYNQSYPQIRQPLAGHNTITGNGQGVRCITHSKAELGLDLSGWYGNNNILTTGYDVYVNSGVPLAVWAKRNWWDGSDPSIYTASGDAVYWDPPCSTQAKIVAGFAVGADLAGEEPERQAYSALSLLLSGNRYEEAVEGFKGVIETYPDSRAAESSLCELIFAYRELEREEEALAYIEEISRKVPDRRVGAASRRVCVPLLSRLGKGTEALALVQELLEVYHETPYERDLLFQKGMIYQYNLGDTEKADEVFERFILKYPDDGISDLARLELNAPAPRSRDEVKTTGKIPGGAALLQSYPNPFNAETILGFTLPQATSVSLVIYDVLGQRVRTLAEGEMASGVHRVRWDGKDHVGRNVSSGVYLVRLSGGHVGVQTRKIMLLR